MGAELICGPLVTKRTCLTLAVCVLGLHCGQALAGSRSCTSADCVGTGEDDVALLQVRGDVQPVSIKVNETTSDSLPLWFGYLREGFGCFASGTVEQLVREHGHDEKKQLRGAALVALLQLDHRPSEADLESAADVMEVEATSCEAQGKAPLDEQMTVILGGDKKLVQMSVTAGNNPKKPSQGLLSVWYNPKMLSAGKGLAYRNTYPGAPGNCVEEGTDRHGLMEVISDNPLHLCPEAAQQDWPYYNTDQAVLAMSFVPLADGSSPFSVLGLSMPAEDFKGKKELLTRTVDDIEQKLGVPEGRIFTLGDHPPRLIQKLAEQGAADNEGAGVQPVSFAGSLTNVARVLTAQERDSQALGGGRSAAATVSLALRQSSPVV